MVLIFELKFDQIPSGTAQQKKFGKGFVYESKNAREARKVYQEQLKKVAPEQPLQNAVWLEIEFDYVIKDKRKKGTLKTSRPDLDNVAKLFIDEMMKSGFFVDDSQIVKLCLFKKFSEDDVARIKVKLEEF